MLRLAGALEWEALPLRPGDGRRGRRQRPQRKRRRGRGGTDGDVPVAVAVAEDFHRRQGLWAIDTVNANGWAGSESYLERSAADVVLLQETKCTSGRRTLAAERAAARAKWGLLVTPAVDTEQNGVSAGVAVAARSHFGMASHGCAAEGPACSRGRTAGGHVSIACKGGMHFISLYMWCSEGLTQRNLDLLQYAAQLLAAVHGPWVVAADFNCEPNILQDSGWLDLVSGVIVKPGRATCGRRTYDYFVVARGLQHAVRGVAVVTDAGFHPHSPVRLYLRGKPRQLLARTLVHPRKFPADLPAGCMPDPARHSEAIAGCGGSLDEVAMLAMQQAEAELSDVAGHDDFERGKHGGRAAGARFVMKVAVGPPGSDRPRCSRVTVAWECIAGWLRAMLQHWPPREGGAHEAAAQRQQWEAARRQILLRDWSALGTGRHAQAVRDWVEAIGPEQLADRATVYFAMQAAARVAQRARAHDERAAADGWHRWLHDGPCKGLGRQHRMARNATGWMPSKLALTAVVDDVVVGETADDTDGLGEDTVQSVGAAAYCPHGPAAVRGR